MESFGRYLAQQRELRALEVEDVARETRLSTTAIEALEGDRFEQLPAPAFVVGYLRSYARAVGLDADELVARYHEQTGTGVEEVRPAPLPSVEEPRRPLPWVAMAAVLVALLLWWWLG